MKRILTFFLLLALLLWVPGEARAATEEKFIFGMVYEGGAAINPLYCNQRDLTSLNELVFESVVTLDDELKPVCELALSYTVKDREYTFELRQNVRFHDGTYMGAYDVVATYEHIMSLGSRCPYYARCSNISKIEVVDMYTIRVTGKHKSFLTMYAMTFPVLQHDSLTMNLPTGTGPYWYMYSDTEWVQIDANPYWWKRAPVVDTVYVFRYDDTASALRALSTGEVDAVPTRSQTAALGRLLSDRMSVDYSTLTYEMLVPNIRSELFKDVRTRKALMYAIDVSTVAQNIYMGMVMKSEVPVITGSWLYEPQSAIDYHSMERALQLLLEAGWGDYNGDGILDKVVNGVLEQLDFTILTYVDDAANTRTHATQLIADQLAPLGIHIEVKTLSKSSVQKRLKNRDFDMVLCGINMAITPDLSHLLNGGDTLNYSGYYSTAMNELMQKLYETTDEAEFKSLMSRAQILLADDLPFLGLFFRKGTLMTTADISGLSAVIEGDVLRGFEYIQFQQIKK